MTDQTTPILVGVAAITQRSEEAGSGDDAIELMIRATRDAAADCGNVAVLKQIDDIAVPKGVWAYSDPARLVADAIAAGDCAGEKAPNTLLANLGVTQQLLISRACLAIAEGNASVMLVTGGESKYRDLRATIAGIEPRRVEQVNVEPDETLVPHAELWSPVESAAGLGMPVGYYAIIDSALRYEQGHSIDQQRDDMAELYAGFSRIAADNPDAWVREPVAAEFIREPSAKNKMLAFPYTKLHNSQWNVDQASAMIFCSVAKARELGIPQHKWVYPLCATESNFMTVVAQRRKLHRCEGFEIAGQRAFELAAKTPQDIEHMEIYSCFPAAVRVQVAELGVDPNRPLSVTGAMTFGGGPLNNFVFQATVKMAQVLRDNPGDTGMVTCVSSFLTKQGVALWSTTPAPNGYGFEDVSSAVAAATSLCEVVPGFDGPATVAGYTVLYRGDAPWRGVVICNLPDGKRTVAYSESAQVMAQMEAAEYCGQEVTLAGNVFEPAAPPPG
jgi:acetyl-CoA C-acetyltransferase